MWFWLYFAGGNYEVTKEYYTYDTNSFIADVGGYLGLCLGLSLLSFFDLGVYSGLWILAKLRGNVSKKEKINAQVPTGIA